MRPRKAIRREQRLGIIEAILSEEIELGNCHTFRYTSRSREIRAPRAFRRSSMRS